MARGPTTFRQRDVTAAVKAARAAGLKVARIEVGKDGKIVVVTDEQLANAADHVGEGEKNEWDDAV